MKKIFLMIQCVFFIAATNAHIFNKERQKPKAKIQKGFLNIYTINGKYYFEIPDSMLNRDILIINRVITSNTNTGMYPGDEIDRVGEEKMIRFEKGEKNTIDLCTVLYNSSLIDSTLSKSLVVDSFSKKIISARFQIISLSKTSKSNIIDATDIVKSGIGITNLGVGSVKYLKTYSMHIEIGTVRDSVGYSMNMSMLLLSRIPMHPRFEDDRVGFRITDYYGRDGIKKISKIHKWRLEPKPEDMEKYRQGELVEPQKPIVFYIDTAVPKKWLSYFIQAVNDWQPAFEKAGFKNAIYALPAPTKKEDSTWSLVDAVHSVIVYKPSTIENAFGYHICDPRSGEIVESHVDWHRDITKIAHDWYMIQAGPNDPRARKMVFDDSLMGQLLRTLLAHEIGHAIGLEHAMGSSSTVPVEKLRNKAWLDTFGISPSIMDYIRANYVAQPEDNIGEKGLIRYIGDYDKWAIEWGYRYFPEFKNDDTEKKIMNKWVQQKLKDHRLWWKKEDTKIVVSDPRVQTEDLGDDIIAAAAYGIKNLKRLIINLPEWTKEPNEDYSSLKRIYSRIVSVNSNAHSDGQYVNYMIHAMSYIGGVYLDHDKTSARIYVPKNKQQEAIAFLNDQLFTTPTWLAPSDITDKIQADPLLIIGNVQQLSLNILLKIQIRKLITQEEIVGNRTYTATDLLNDMKTGIWSELVSHKSIDTYRQNLQNRYINSLIPILYPDDSKVTKLSSIVRKHLLSLHEEIKIALPAFSGTSSQHYLEETASKVNKLLNEKN